MSKEHANVRFSMSSDEQAEHLKAVADQHGCAKYRKKKGLVIKLGMYLSGTKLAPTATQTFRKGGRFTTHEGMKPAQSVREVLLAAYDVHPDFNHEIFNRVRISYGGREYKFREVFFDADHASDFLHQVEHLDADHRRRPFIICARPVSGSDARAVGGYKNLRVGGRADPKAFEVPCAYEQAKSADGTSVSLRIAFQVWHDPAVMEQLSSGEPVAYIGTLMSDPQRIRQKLEDIKAGRGKDKRLLLDFRILRMDDIVPIKPKTLSPQLRYTGSDGQEYLVEDNGQASLDL